MSLYNGEAFVVCPSVCPSVCKLAQIASTRMQMAGSPPNFHKMDSRSTCIQGVLKVKVKVKVKGHVITDTRTFLDSWNELLRHLRSGCLILVFNCADGFTNPMSVNNRAQFCIGQTDAQHSSCYDQSFFDGMVSLRDLCSPR